MSIASLFDRRFWVWDDTEYVYPDNVVPFPSPHARANAAQAAQLVEDDRAATRRQELRHDLLLRRRERELEIAQIDAALAELAGG